MGPERPPSVHTLVRREHIDKVYRAMRVRLHDSQLAWDATNDLFVVALSPSTTSFDPARGSFEGWLLGLVRFVAMRAWQREMRRPEPIADVIERLDRTAWDLPEPSLPHISDELRTAIGALGERERALLFLRAVEGWSSRAVGEHLGMTETAVTTGYKRVRARLAAMMELPEPA